MEDMQQAIVEVLELKPVLLGVLTQVTEHQQKEAIEINRRVANGFSLHSDCLPLMGNDGAMCRVLQILAGLRGVGGSWIGGWQALACCARNFCKQCYFGLHLSYQVASRNQMRSVGSALQILK